MKILITGGAGFVGSHVVDAYLADGHEIIVVDNLSTGKKSNINPLAKFYKTDIRSTEAVNTIFNKEKPDIVNHLAAQKSVQQSIHNPLHDADINIIGLLSLLKNSVNHSVKKFIFTSTGGALYGNAKIIPTPETHIPDILSPYALTKYMGEEYVKLFHRLYNVSYTILRPSNIYGPRQISEGENGVIAIFFENLMKGKPSVLYHFSDMKKGATRDYVFVEDVARANILALEKGNNEVFNIGTGTEMYTLDIYSAINDIVKKKARLHKKITQNNEVRRSALDCQKASKLLNWRPIISLEDGLTRTYQSYL